MLGWYAGGNINGNAVFDPSGVSTPITGLPWGGVQAVRVVPTGFRIAFNPSFGPARQESWIIGKDGVATLEGTFAAAPANTVPSTLWGYGALDAAGNLFEIDWVHDLVVRRPLEPGLSTTVYTGVTPAGFNDIRAKPFQPYLRNPHLLVTGP